MKSGRFFISGISKFNMLETKIRPRKLLRRLIKIYVVCFVSTGGEINMAKHANDLRRLLIPFMN